MKGFPGSGVLLGSGADFRAAAGKERFDLAFLDIYMGSENGVDTARALRRFDADCLLVFITIYFLAPAVPFYRAECIHAPCQSWYLKPGAAAVTV